MGKKAVGYWVQGGRGEFVGGVSIGSSDAMVIWEKLSKGTEFKPGKGVPKVVRVVSDQDLVDKWKEALDQGDVRNRWEEHRDWWTIDEAIRAIDEEETVSGKGKQVVVVKAINKEGESQSSKGNNKERTGGVPGVSGKVVDEGAKVGRGKGRRVSGGRSTSKERGAGKKAKGRQGRRKGGKYMACIECYLQEEGHAGQSEWIQCDRCDGWAAVGCVRELPEGYEEEDTDWYCKQCRAIIELIQASKELRDTERYRQQEEERRKRWEEGIDRRLSEMQNEVQQGNQASIGGGVAMTEQLHKLQESMEFMVQYMVGVMAMDGEEVPDGDGEGAGMEIPANMSVPEMREWCEGKVRDLKRIQETSGKQARIWWEMEKAIWENRSGMSLDEIKDVRRKAKVEARAWWHAQEEVRRGWGQLQVVQSQEQIIEVNGKTTGKGKGKGKGSGRGNCDQHQLSRTDVSSVKETMGKTGIVEEGSGSPQDGMEGIGTGRGEETTVTSCTEDVKIVKVERIDPRTGVVTVEDDAAIDDLCKVVVLDMGTGVEEDAIDDPCKVVVLDIGQEEVSEGGNTKGEKVNDMRKEGTKKDQVRQGCSKVSGTRSDEGNKSGTVTAKTTKKVRWQISTITGKEESAGALDRSSSRRPIKVQGGKEGREETTPGGQVKGCGQKERQGGKLQQEESRKRACERPGEEEEDGKKRRCAGRGRKTREMQVSLIGDSQWGQITMCNELMKVAWDKGWEVRIWRGGKIWQIAKMVNEVDGEVPKVVVSLGGNDLAGVGVQGKRGAEARVRTIVVEAMKLLRRFVRPGRLVGVLLPFSRADVVEEDRLLFNRELTRQMAALNGMKAIDVQAGRPRQEMFDFYLDSRNVHFEKGQFWGMIQAVMKEMEVCQPGDIMPGGIPVVGDLVAEGQCWTCGEWHNKQESECQWGRSGEQCRRCGGWGHSGITCLTQVKMCMRCGWRGHMQRDCVANRW